MTELRQRPPAAAGVRRGGRHRAYRRRPPGRPRPPRVGRRYGRWIRRGLAALTVLVLVLAGVVFGYGWYLNSEIHRVHVRALSQSVAGAEQDTENILLVGSTSRCALKVQNPAFGLCSQGITGVNSDVVMLLHLNPARHSASLLSIPRDLFVPNARAVGANKIDAALVEGPDQLVDAIQDDFGIPIQHYVELNFDTFAGVVDALGGVRMYFPEPVYDAYSGLKVLEPGCRYLNGFQALQVVRARHLQYKGPGVVSDDPADWPQEAESDLARIRRDHEFLRVLASAVARNGLGNPVTDEQLAASVAPQLTVDSGLSAVALVRLMLDFHAVDPYRVPQVTLPVVVTTFGSYRYDGGDYGDVEFPAEPMDQQVIDQFLGIGASTSTTTGAPLPKPAAVTVTVRSTTGAGPGAPTAAALRALGFRVAAVGQSPAAASYQETVVYYATRSAAPAAETVLRSLSGYVVMAFDPGMVDPGAQVTVVTGTDFAVAQPAAAVRRAVGSTTRPTSRAGGTGGTGTAGAAGAAGGPPTAPVQPLAPWDPRSCTASGGPGP